MHRNAFYVVGFFWERKSYVKKEVNDAINVISSEEFSIRDNYSAFVMKKVV